MPVNTYIALFRGINIGGKNILPMKELVEFFEAMDCKNIQTYIQSGNVVFHSRKIFNSKHTAEIGRRIREKKGFEPKILLLSPADLRAAIKHNPFPTDDGKALHFMFLESTSQQPDMDSLAAVKFHSEAFVLHGNVFYLYAPDGVGRSRLPAKMEKALGVSVTGRNWNTVAKLAAMVEQA